MIKTDYTREELVAICEKAIVSSDKWEDRDTSQAQIGVGTCWAFLKAGCKFEICTSENRQDKGTVTDKDTIWIQFWVKDFIWFENLYDDDDDPEFKDGRDNYDYHYYLPTPERLEGAGEKDWY